MQSSFTLQRININDSEEEHIKDEDTEKSNDEILLGEDGISDMQCFNKCKFIAFISLKNNKGDLTPDKKKKLFSKNFLRIQAESEKSINKLHKERIHYNKIQQSSKKGHKIKFPQRLKFEDNKMLKFGANNLLLSKNEKSLKMKLKQQVPFFITKKREF